MRSRFRFKTVAELHVGIEELETLEDRLQVVRVSIANTVSEGLDYE